MIEERRRFFRIEDFMGVACRHLGEQEAKVFSRQRREQAGQFDFASNFDNRIQTLVDACKIQSPLAAELIDLMNKKLNFVIQQLDVDSSLLHQVVFTQRMVSVSACGMGFMYEQALQKNTFLQLDLQLLPSKLQLVTLAKVIECNVLSANEITDNKTHFVRLEFLEMNSNDQELLIQHIVKRQSGQIKQRRDDS
ncbi:PilZ domain-containing protein [Oceanicoccus sp. KOV_DT_Chl]|uniref:PilZ domain-containing protein n=1 Tax=Oceanicoccus sp. KOV_DT_Chl TaxID=1904639 RepID=UPI000C7D2658|nr:PilZ domain-containing protein [Oceanicoccus sp. KOV_DT_Chl]